jgi:dihydrofolate reductase
MGKVVVITNLTLDGVMQAPGHSDEDTRGGFEHGGWAAPFGAMQQPEAGAAFANMGALLFGRLTYERFYAFWPNQTNNPFTAFLNNIPKYVASSTLEEPLPWSNSTLIKSDVAETLAELKAEQDKDLVVFGSGVLVQSLMRWNLVDEYVLLIHPLVLGSGRQLFSRDGTFAALTLRDSKTTTNGVIVATYEPANNRNAV